jgi:hypothetical protein
MPDMTPDPEIFPHASPAAVRRLVTLSMALFAVVGAQAQLPEERPSNTVCQALRGMLVPVCNGAICTEGKVTGDLQGRYTSRVTSMYVAGSGWLYTAWTRIELDGGKGRIETLNQGTAPPDAQGGADQARSIEVLRIDEATGAYQDHTGTLVLTGGHQVGRPTPYSGRICHPMAARGPSAG